MSFSDDSTFGNDTFCNDVPDDDTVEEEATAAIKEAHPMILLHRYRKDINKGKVLTVELRAKLRQRY